MNKLIAALAVSVIAAGCAHQQPKEEPKPAATTQAPQAATPPPAPAPKAESRPAVTKPVAVNPLDDPNSLLSRRSIYYDFDDSTIKDQYKPLVQAHAGYLSSHSGAKIRVEGNCDERGSREYNLALGQRRADAVRSAMEVLGAKQDQVETVSWGAEKPKALGHDEAAWAEDRRSDILYEKQQ